MAKQSASSRISTSNSKTTSCLLSLHKTLQTSYLQTKCNAALGRHSRLPTGKIYDFLLTARSEQISHFSFHLKSFPSTAQQPIMAGHCIVDEATLSQVLDFCELIGFQLNHGLDQMVCLDKDQKRHNTEMMLYTIQAGHLDRCINAFQTDSHISSRKINRIQTLQPSKTLKDPSTPSVLARTHKNLCHGRRTYTH